MNPLSVGLLFRLQILIETHLYSSAYKKLIMMIMVMYYFLCVQDYHGISADAVHTSDMDASKIKESVLILSEEKPTI